jgi:NADPH:quinone reductase-like Zn-dependent oxidoreductase
VLIQVKACSVNALDWGFLRGMPRWVRLMSGFGKPKFPIPCRDVSGIVVSAGPGATLFKPGDEVFGTCLGACAEFACPKESRLALKPAEMSFEEAASLPVAGVTALQALRKFGKLKPGQTVLINGASGGVGTFGVLLAQAMGARVTAVCSSRHLDKVHGLGVEEVIDYTQQDFLQTGKTYDLIFDNVSDRSYFAIRRAMKPEGVLVAVGAPRKMGFWKLIRLVARPSIFSLFGKRKFRLVSARIDPADLMLLGEYAAEGKLEGILDRVHPFDEAHKAIRHLAEGHAAAKIVIRVECTAESQSDAVP